VIIRKAPEGEYVTEWREVEFLPGSLQAIFALHRRGFAVIVVTNQRGLATGKLQQEKVDEIHARLRETVAQSGGHISGIYCCPHDAWEACPCRKPKPGMLLQAAAKHRLHLPACWMVGDSASDIAAGKSTGCKTALISSSQSFEPWAEQADICAESLALAAECILSLEREISRTGK
jgi:D-glycero-D-manno-heptose 1,7-bisphosphate phosphatase